MPRKFRGVWTMKHWILAGVALAVVGTTVYGVGTYRRDVQYRALIEAGDTAGLAGEGFAAIEAFSGAIALRPGSMLAWLKRGEVYLRRGDHRSAMRDLRQAAILDPAAPRPLELLGDTQAAQERYGRAAGHYESYLRLDDRDAGVLYKLGFALVQEGRTDDAAAALIRAVRLDDQRADAHHLLGLCLGQQRRTREAIRALERSIALAPAMVAAREALAEQYRRAGRTDEQVRQLEAIMALDPGQPGRYIAVAEAWARAGRSNLAVTTLVSAIERFPENPTLLTTLGRVWLDVAQESGDRVALVKALEALRRATAADQADTTSLALLGRAQLLAGDIPNAVRSLQRATAVLPVDPQALADLATAAERAGRLAQARDALVSEAALVGDTSPPRARAQRALRVAALSERLGDRTAALAWLERAAAAAPDDRAIAARLAAFKES